MQLKAGAIFSHLVERHMEPQNWKVYQVMYNLINQYILY